MLTTKKVAIIGGCVSYLASVWKLHTNNPYHKGSDLWSRRPPRWTHPQHLRHTHTIWTTHRFRHWFYGIQRCQLPQHVPMVQQSGNCIQTIQHVTLRITRQRKNRRMVVRRRNTQPPRQQSPTPQTILPSIPKWHDSFQQRSSRWHLISIQQWSTSVRDNWSVSETKGIFRWVWHTLFDSHDGGVVVVKIGGYFELSCESVDWVYM